MSRATVAGLPDPNTLVIKESANHVVKLTVGNSYSRVEGLSPKDEKILREALSYVVGGSSAHFSGFGPKRRSLLDKKGNFPTGLAHRVAEYILKNSYDFDVTDPRSKPKATPSKTDLGIEPYKAQREAVRAAHTAERGIISMPTGTGKSLVIKMLCASFNLKTLVIVPSLEIRKQLEYGLKGLPNVTVRNIDSGDLKTLTDFDVLIIDEAHHSAAKTYRALNKTAWTKIYYRFFTTATPFRTDTEETLLFESVAGQVIYQLSYKDAIKEKYIVPVEAYVIDIPKQDNDYYTWAEVYSKLVVNNTPRNVIICALLARLHSAQKSTLCLVKEVAQGKILSKMTGLPFVSGADDDSRKYIQQFNKGNIKVLIGTTGILGEGIDTKPCEYVLVAGLGKAKSQLMQQIGRSVRNYPGKESGKVIVFKDRSHRFTLRHYAAQKKILLDEYGVKPLNIKI